MNIVIKIIGLILTFFEVAGGIINPFPVYRKIENNFSSSAKMSYSEQYYEISENRSNNTETWRQGMVSGNGLQGVVASGSPYNDTLIYQNQHFIMPNNNLRYTPDSSAELETVKQAIVNGENITDNQSYDDVYCYHPGAFLRLKQSKHLKVNYARYTDYETAVTGVQYTDIKGTWKRETFTSQADGVTITKIGSSSNGSKVNLTLSMDNISTIANFGNGNEKYIKYKKTADKDGNYLAFSAHYPEFENSELKNGGYTTVVYVVCEGGTKAVENGKTVKDEQYCAETNPTIKIKNADNVYLIALSERSTDMGSMNDFVSADTCALVTETVDSAKAVADKYTTSGKFDYDSALKAHTDIFTPQYNAVTFTLGTTDSTKSNEALVFSQYGKNAVNSDLAERAYYNGRYAYLCCAGYSTPRLYGMWTGEWAGGWGAKYTMDANVNLQASSMNTGNMPSTYEGYAAFILRQLPSWEQNALATHGFTEAIQSPVNTDGDLAPMETCYPYPFRYWNAGTSWMILPLYETLQYYGDVSIPINGEFDLSTLKSVLSPVDDDLTDEDIAALEAKGELDLRTEILLPLLVKSANYWDQLMSPDYYTDSKGNIKYEKGKTELKDGEKFAILPGYSPENNPSNYPSPSCANAAIDIAACGSNLEMLIDIMKSIDPDADVSHWEYLLENLPPYTFDETGALKEWCCNQFEENNSHRHLSHLYCVWPLSQTQDNEQLKQACIQAVANRASENQASHALIHRALISARLKDGASVNDSLVGLMSSGIYYDSLNTNHDYDRNSCYCTDFAIGYPGIVNESLVYSEEGLVEILPALPTTGFETGKVTGLRAIEQITINSLEWSKAGTKVTLTSDIDQTITLTCGVNGRSKELKLTKGTAQTVEFTY